LEGWLQVSGLEMKMECQENLVVATVKSFVWKWNKLVVNFVILSQNR